MADGTDSTRPDAASDSLSGAALLQLWLSPSFPVGAYAYSHGLEAAVAAGWITARGDLEAWLNDLVELGSLRNDLILLAAASRAVRAHDDAALHTTAELAAALQPSAERFLETTQQGASFLAAIHAAWPAPTLEALAARPIEPLTYPVAVGIAVAAHDIALELTLPAFGLAWIGTLTSAAIRLGVIGQTDGQRVIAALAGPVATAARGALGSTLDDLGGCTWRSDLASLQHETLYTRLFRS